MLARAARRLRTKCIFKNVHPQNSNHLRPHSRTITTLDHSRFGLGNKFSGKQIRPNLLRSTSLLYKILPTNLGVCKSNFLYFLHITSELKQCHSDHTDPGQNAVFHNFFKADIHEKITRFLLAEKGVQFFCNTSANYKWFLIG